MNTLYHVRTTEHLLHLASADRLRDAHQERHPCGYKQPNT